MTITSKAVLVTLQIEMLGTEERDRRLSADVNTNYLTVNAGFYHKCKIDKRHLRPVRGAAHVARIYHRKNTVPWDGYARLLVASKALEYSNKMSEFKVNFENAVHDLKLAWPVIIQTEQTRLGNLFNPADYPVQADIDKYFSFGHQIEPVPDKSHLVLDIENEVLEEIKKKLDNENKLRIEDAKKEMYVKLLEPVSRMANICSNDKKVYDTMIKDVIDVTTLLTELSNASLGDPELMAKLADVKAKLVGYTPGQIRNDKRLKKQLGVNAAAIASEIQNQLGMAPPPN